MSTNSSTAASLFGAAGRGVEPRGGRVALALTPARSQVGGAAVGDGLVERGGRCFGGGVLEYDGGVGHGAGVRERDRELLEQRVADSASNATVASETGTGSATVLVSAGSGRWQVQSHVTSCAATVYYSYLGVASSATAYSTVHAKTVENVTVGTPIPQSTTSVPVSWALSAVGTAGTRGADVRAAGGELLRAGVTRTGSLASGTITAGATSAT
eukprot:tig00021723_g23250.t1